MNRIEQIAWTALSDAKRLLDSAIEDMQGNGSLDDVTKKVNGSVEYLNDFKNRTCDMTIVASPWQDENCPMTIPNRVVLRVVHGELVVHTELRSNPTSYTGGHYFKYPASIDDLEKIVKIMKERQ